MEEIRESFLEESEELFEQINTLLLLAENTGTLSKEDIDTLFRNIHTLKGGSGSVGFDKFSKITHIFETFMDKLRDDVSKVNKEVIDFLIDGSDTLNNILKDEFLDDLDDGEFKEKFQFFKNKSENFLNNSKKSNSKQKLLEKNGGEIIDLFEAINKKLSQNLILDGEDIKELFREVHTLKASSQFIGLKYFPKYLQELEGYLDQIREKNCEYTEKSHTFLKKAIKIAEALIDEELNNNKSEIEYILVDIKKEIANLKKIHTEKDFELFDESEEESLGFEIFEDDDKTEEIEEKIEEEIEEEIEEIIPLKTTSLPSKQENKEKDKKKLSLKNIISSSSIRVSLEKIDTLMNKVGDLVITKSMLFQFADALDDFDIRNLITERLEVLDRNIRELQESVMGVRMVPMSSVYSKLPKIIRDLSKKLNKQVNFEHFGDTVEIDKLMVEALMDPLTHILRNALDHGLETSEKRKQSNKSLEGRLTISAAQESGQIIITIEDDGAGINTTKVGQKAIEKGIITKDEFDRMSIEELAMLIFSAGLSTADEISDVSGRGVGMDVVMNNINSIGGNIKVDTKEGIGTKFIIVLPLTLAILDGLNVRIGKDKFIYPLNMVLESFQPIPEIIKNVVNEEEVLILRDEFIPVIRLHRFFGIEPIYTNLTDGIVIISKVETQKVAIFVDEFMTQEQIVVKSLEKNFKKVKGISASTIRGDGSVGLILDIANIVAQSKR